MPAIRSFTLDLVAALSSRLSGSNGRAVKDGIPQTFKPGEGNLLDGGFGDSGTAHGPFSVVLSL